MITFLQFEFPLGLTADKFIAELAAKVDLQQHLKQAVATTYYDSFDWRLYGQNLSCDITHSEARSTVTVRQLDNDAFVASTDIKAMPVFSTEFNPDIRPLLEPILEMRALTAVCTVNYARYQLHVLNKEEKTVLRLVLEAYDDLTNRVFLQPIKGYDTAAEHIIDILTEKLDLTPVRQPLLLAALAQQGRKPNDYSSKLTIQLAPDMRADIASKYIYSHLLNAIKVNEIGTLNATDSEFLHDFRVAVRRTRAGLSQLKGVLPEAITAHFTAFFSWLGQITSTTRDLDVYVLSFEVYKNSLPAAMRDDLKPLYQFLVGKQQKAQRDMAKKLRSPQYVSGLSEWEDYLKEESFNYPLAANAHLTIKQLADRRIWKIYQRVIEEGDAIHAHSPAEELHELRKSCKKLRYLMEFFQSLYPEKQIKKRIGSLKQLQEVLGDFQDYQVQENTLRAFGEDMRATHIPVATFLAMGVLIQRLDSRRCEVRTHFNARFLAFKQAENAAEFKVLFAAPKHPNR